MSPIPRRNFGGDATDVAVGAIGYGAMMLTWVDPASKPKQEDAIAAIKAAVDAGATFINSGQFYGPPEDPEANLKLLRAFYDQYPEYVDKTVVSVKGGMKPEGLMAGPDSSIDNLRRDLKSIQAALGDKKRVDLYEPARVDPKMRIEDIMENLVTLQKEGLFKHISLSEIAASALRRAAKVGPVAAVEIELSIFMREQEAFDVLDACKELDIALVAYSPLGRGLLAGKFKSADDVKPGSMQARMPQFQGENLTANIKLAEMLGEMATKRGVTAAQLALAYILQLYPKVIPIPGSSSAERTRQNIEAANVELSADELTEIRKSTEAHGMHGDRYPHNALNWGTGRD